MNLYICISCFLLSVK